MTESEINVKVAELRGWKWFTEVRTAGLYGFKSIPKKHRRKFLMQPSCANDCHEIAPEEMRRAAFWMNGAPPVATCANAAMELVEVMAEKGFEFSSRRNSFMPPEHRWKAAFCEPSREYEATAPTQALAISKAFIAANEGREG